MNNLQEIKNLKNEITKDYETTELFANETINDYLNNEIELAECVTYIRLCIKRINILKNAIYKSGIFDEKYIEEFNKKSELLLLKMNPLKGKKETKLDDSAKLTCNSILKVFKVKYQHYSDKNENLFEM